MLVSSLVVVIVGEQIVGGSGVVFRFLTTLPDRPTLLFYI